MICRQTICKVSAYVFGHNFSIFNPRRSAICKTMKQFFITVLIIVLVGVAVVESRRRILSRKILQTSCSKKCKGAYNTIAWNEDDKCECCPKVALKCKTFKKCKRDAATGCVSCSCATT